MTPHDSGADKLEATWTWTYADTRPSMFGLFKRLQPLAVDW